MHLAGSAEARESAGSAEAREPAGSAEARASAGSAEESALVPQSAAGQQEATGVMPAWRSISIAARVLPAAVVPVPKQVSDKCSPMPGEAPALRWVMGRSVAALAPLPATTIQRRQRTAEQTG
jgi:hypothetical protein